jgi:hypothetical protein
VGVRANFDAFQRAPRRRRAPTLAASHLSLRIELFFGL